MSFGGNPSNNPTPSFGITRNRKTHVKFNDERTILLEPAFVLERIAPEIGRTTSDKRQANKVILHEAQSGWIVKNLWDDQALSSERNEASSAYIGVGAGAGAAAVGAFHEVVYEWRRPNSSYQLNVLSGASANLLTQGRPFIRKKVGAGLDWSTAGITADATAFPFPVAYQNEMVDDSSIAMDRVFVTNSPDRADQDIMFQWHVPKGIGDTPQLEYQLSFVGPATGPTDIDEESGKGQYVLNFYGNGHAELFEKLTNDVWRSRMVFKYTDSPGDKYKDFKIYKYNYTDPKKNGVSGRLVFVSGMIGPGANTGMGVDWQFSKSSDLKKLSECPTYTARCGPIKPPTYETAIRVSERRDLRGSFAVAVAKRPEEAELQDDPFSLPFYPRTIPVSISGDGVLSVYWFAEIPSGCTVTCKLYRADTGAELTYFSGGSNYRSYAPVLNLTTYFVKIFFTTDGVKTPILHSYSVARPCVFDTSSETEEEFTILRGVSIVGPEKTPQHENATVLISNLANDADLLRTRGSIPFKVEVEWQPDVDRADRCVLFKGFTQRVTATRRVRMLNSKAGQTFHEYQVQGTSMYQRLKEQVNPYKRRLWNDAEGLPFKVTDLLYDFLTAIGHAPSELNIPDLPIRAYGSVVGAGETLESLDDLGNLIYGLLRKYLAHPLVYDANAGLNGQWTLITPPSSPYTNVAKFIFGPDDLDTPPAGPVLGHARSTYITNSLPTGFIRKGTFKSWVKPPEGNVIIASCLMKTTPNSVPSCQFQVFPNFKSYDFGNGLVDPDHPDYLGRMVPLYVMAPEIYSLQEFDSATGQWENPALNWIGRRVFDIAAHAVKFCTFEAPLLLIDEENPSTYEKRPLRYYDPVLIDGEQFLIRNVNPSYRKDYHQWATYECEAPRI